MIASPFVASELARVGLRSSPEADNAIDLNIPIAWTGAASRPNASKLAPHRGGGIALESGVPEGYPAVKWEVSTLICFSRPSTRLHSAGKNNRVNTVPTRTPPIST